MNHPAVVVTFADDLDMETAQNVCALLRQIKGVINVTPVEGEMSISRLARMQADTEWSTALRDVMARRR